MKLSALKRESLPGPLPRLTPSRSRTDKRELGKGAVAGLVGGLIGTIVMTQFQNAWSGASKSIKTDNGGQQSEGEQKQESQQQSEDATMKAAGKIAKLGGRQLSHEQKKKLGPVVHYSFGTLQGGMYGALAELVGVSGGFLPGIAFGAALFGLADEMALPALGLSGSPTESPLSSHLYGLVSHLVYGISTEVARRGLRAAL